MKSFTIEGYDALLSAVKSAEDEIGVARQNIADGVYQLEIAEGMLSALYETIQQLKEYDEEKGQ
jgi:flagellin-like hook-associated protein FlgL